jgi:Mitochondrial carrier protein
MLYGVRKCYIQVLPFWTVKISAVAQRGRLSQLWPFQGYTVALSAILKDEGVTGLFKGAVPVCTGVCTCTAKYH